MTSSVRWLRWLARGLGLALLLFWGTFFVEHLVEWFFGPRLPPPYVWLAQTLHLGLLVGYAMAWRWELAGSLVILACGATFFAVAGAPVYIVPSVLPAVLHLVCWFRERPGNLEPRPAAPTGP